MPNPNLYPNHNLNLILTSTLKLSRSPKTSCLFQSEDWPKCPHFPKVSSLPRSKTQIGPHEDRCTTALSYTHTHTEKTVARMTRTAACQAFNKNIYTIGQVFTHTRAAGGLYALKDHLELSNWDTS